MSLVTRRAFVRSLGLGTGALLVAACQPASPGPSPTTVPAAKPTEAPASTAVKPTSAPAAASPATARPIAAPPSPGSNAGAVTRLTDVQTLAPRGSIKLALNTTGALYLPLFRAVHNGAFQRAGVDVEVVPTPRAPVLMLPDMARGAHHVSDMVANPALFNQLKEGFDVRVLASMGVPKEGRLNDVWLCVQKGKESEIKEFADLKGRTIEAGNQGSPLDLICREAVRAGGLDPEKDVTLTYRVKDAPDFVALAQNRAFDVIGMPEPIATLSQQQGLVVKWKTYGFGNLAPWFKPSLLAANGTFMDQNRAVMEKFLEVYLVSCREVNAANGQWTDDFVNEVAGYSKIPADVIRAEGAPPYFDPNGTVDQESLARNQDAWAAMGLVQQKQEVPRLVDTQVLAGALSRVGRLPA